ncbi:MAG TPA: hypothetical protein DHU93_15285, partial [Algoriphagus sp.]|nr:hypothetical protein [Algoriphagus sp.]
RIKITEHEKVYTEFALSSRDKNLFSTIDNEDNQGIAWKLGLESSKRQSKLLPGYELSGKTEFEYNSSNFNFIDRFRYIEFDRDWGITQEELRSAAAERFIQA